MLDPWIIEQIRRREQDEQQHREQPVLELPLDVPYYPGETPAPGPKPGERGVFILDLG